MEIDVNTINSGEVKERVGIQNPPCEMNVERRAIYEFTRSIYASPPAPVLVGNAIERTLP